jgi:hypothetical protein
MHIRLIARLLPLFAAVLMLPGCINYEQNTKLRSDGSGTMVIHYWTEESVANFMSGDKLNFNGSEVPQQYQAKGVTVKKAEAETNASDSTRHMRVTLEFDDITALSNTKGFKGTKFTFVRTGNNIVFKQVMEANSSAGGLGLEKYAITYVYDMPGTVVSSNATKVEGSTLTWSYKLPELSKEVMLTATISVGGGLSGGMLAAIIGAAVVLISVITFILLRRKSSAPVNP